MVPALILVLATWCPSTTTTGPDRPRCCPCPSTTTTSPTEPSTTSTTEPRLIIEPPHLVPPTPPTAPTTTTTVPAIVDATTITRPPRARDLPVTGPDGGALVAAGTLLLLGGLLLAAGRRRDV